MLQEFRTTIDAQGHFDFPLEFRKRYGLMKGALVTVQARGQDFVVHVENEEERKARQLAAIDAAIGILPSDSNTLEHMLEDRRKDREREDRPFGV